VARGSTLYNSGTVGTVNAGKRSTVNNSGTILGNISGNGSVVNTGFIGGNVSLGIGSVILPTVIN
jgi:hypothetical protein